MDRVLQELRPSRIIVLTQRTIPLDRQTTSDMVMASLAKTTMIRQRLLTSSSTRFLFMSASRLTPPATAVTFKSQPLQRSAFVPRTATFHTTTPREILPPGPQVIEGGVNVPAPVPAPSPTHGSYHWTFERLMAAGLIPLTTAPFIGGSLNPTLDAVFVAALIIHSHIGFQ